MPQNQITEPESADDLPELGRRQKAYVWGRLQGLSRSEAYRRAYPGNQTDESIWASSAKLDNNKTIRAWLRYAQRQGAIQASCTFESHLNELAALRDEAKAAGNYGAAVNAEVNRGKVAGLYIERTLDLTKAKQSDTKALEILERLLGPDAAINAAQRLGLDYVPAIEGERVN